MCSYFHGYDSYRNSYYGATVTKLFKYFYVRFRSEGQGGVAHAQCGAALTTSGAAAGGPGRL